MKTALDQLRDGLSCLGFLEKMNKYPALFEELFVFNGSSLTSEAVVSRLKFPTSRDDEEKRVNGILTVSIGLFSGYFKDVSDLCNRCSFPPIFWSADNISEIF